MAPVRQKRRGSDQSTASARRQGAPESSKVLLKGGATTPRHRSPIKKQKRGISLRQKQALIDNLQLEITERARRLRAQCSLQAQGLRSRIEIRVNRIPVSLRKLKMGELLLRYAEQEQQQQQQQQQQQGQQQQQAASARPAPVATRDIPRLSPQKFAYGARPPTAGLAYKGMSSEHAGDKENELENMDLKKRMRAAQGADAGHVRPAQVLSPTSSNSRRANCERPPSPTKTLISRPGSPLKSSGTSRSAAVTSVLSSMVERAKASRSGRKVTTASEASSASSGAAAATAPAGRKPMAAPPGPKAAPPSRPATRTGRRASGMSETSEVSTGTVVRKTGPGRPATATKKTTMGTIRRGVTGAGAKKAAAAGKPPPSTASASSAGGRVLRKRG